MWKIVTLVPEIKLSPLDGISHNRMLWRKKKFWQMEIQAGWAGYREELSDYGHFPGPWVEDGEIYDLTSRLQLRWPLCCCGWHNRAPCWRSSRWSAERRAHPQATADVCHHPLPPKKVSFQHLTHHDASDADAHIPDDVKFVIKEVLDLWFTVLQSKLMSDAVRDGYKTIC